MNHPHTQKSSSGSVLSSDRESGNSRHHSTGKEPNSNGTGKAYHENATSRLRQRRVCLPGFWVSNP